jgi:hypothetical protein
MERSQHHHRLASGAPWALGLGVLTLLVSTAVLAQDNQFQLFVSAVDASGNPVLDLSPGDISFAESGAPGKVVSVDRFSLPIKLTIVIDNNPDSARVLAQIRDGLTSAVSALPKDVEVAVYTAAPSPRPMARMTSNREEVVRAIERFGPDTERARFSDALVEYGQRLESDFKDKKLTYIPVLLLVWTTAAEVTSIQLDTLENGLRTVAIRGTRVYAAVTSTETGNRSQIEQLDTGRVSIISQQLVKNTRGRFQALQDFRTLAETLPQWGKEMAGIHTRQTTQFRVVLERPAAATGPLNPANLDIRVTRPGLTPSVSGDGRFLPQ